MKTKIMCENEAKISKVFHSGSGSILKRAYVEVERKNAELVKVNEMIAKRVGELEESNRHKSEFIANMAHEFRNPLNNINLLSMLLSDNREKNLTARQIEYANTINTSCKELLHLVDDFLDISRAESGKMEVVVAEAAISDFKMKLERGFTPLAEHGGLGFSVVVDENVPDFIVTDMRRVDQILKNLLSNAFRFTEKGEIKVTISRPPAGETKLKKIGLSGLDPLNVVAFSVSDTGTGIPEDKQELVFEVYRQAEATTSRDYGGSGLGLPISRVMAQLLGGDIFLESEWGRGSTFTLYLPVGEGEEGKKELVTEDEAHAPVLLKERGWALEGRKILIIDDDMRNVYSLIDVLEAEGAEVAVGSTGKKGLAFLHKHPDTDMVLLEMAIPVVDGYQVLSEIRGDEKLRDMPVVALTDRVRPGERERTLKAGVDGHLAKPVNVDELFSIMDLLSSTRLSNF